MIIFAFRNVKTCSALLICSE